MVFRDKKYQTPVADPCQPPLRSRQTLYGPRIFYATINNPGPNAQADVLVQLGWPCNAFYIASMKGGTEASSVFFHLAKMNKTYAGANVATVATGNEPWISMTTLPASGPIYRTMIRFREKIFPQFFLDIGFEGGAGLITIACVEDDDILINGGIYT